MTCPNCGATYPVYMGGGGVNPNYTYLHCSRCGYNQDSRAPERYFKGKEARVIAMEEAFQTVAEKYKLSPYQQNLLELLVSARNEDKDD